MMTYVEMVVAVVLVLTTMVMMNDEVQNKLRQGKKRRQAGGFASCGDAGGRDDRDNQEMKYLVERHRVVV